VTLNPTGARAQLAAVILTKNVREHIVPCIDTLRFADRIVVSDSFSTDGTATLAQDAGAEVLQRPFDNFAGQRNAAMDAVDAEWIFFVDADERIPEPLAVEVRGVLSREEAGWWVPRHNFMVGQQVRHGGFYPDYQLRLLRRDAARYDPSRPVHEVVQLQGTSGYLKEPMLHYNYDDWGQFHAKQRRYAALESRILKERGVRPWPHKFIRQPLREFWRRYVRLQGWRDGGIGLRLAGLLAFYYGFMPHWYLVRPPK
jgi:glycosyltransferase involved in cell wall biosynthesis